MRWAFVVAASARYCFGGASAQHVLLACRGPWDDFRRLVTAVTLEDRPPCSAAGAAGGTAKAVLTSTAEAFAVAHQFLDSMWTQVEKWFLDSHTSFEMCWALDSGETAAAIEEQLGEPLGSLQFQCLYGWVTAALCKLQVLRDLGDMEGSAASTLHIALRQRLERDLAEPQVEVALGDHDILPGILRGLFYSGGRLLSLLDSSGWPARLTHVADFLPDGPWPVLDSASLATADAFATRAIGRGLLEAWPPEALGRELHVWAISLHGTLAMEPISVWNALAETGALTVRVTAVLLKDHCGRVEGAARCDNQNPLGELLVGAIDFQNGGLDGGRFPLLRDPEAFRASFLDLAPRVPELAAADLLFGGEPAFICGLLWELGRQPVVGYVGNPLGAYLPPGAQEAFYSSVFSGSVAGSGPRLAFVAMSPSLAAQAYWQTGVEMPVVRPLGRYTQATHWPQTHDVLVTKQIFHFWDFACLLNSAAAALSEPSQGWRFVDMKLLEDRSWANWARHRAAVLLPYEPYTLVFYELYGMAMPLLVPSQSLLPLFFMRGYASAPEVAYRRPGWDARSPMAGEAAWGRFHQEASYSELAWWAALSDMARLPHLLTWASLAELLERLEGPEAPAQLQAASHAMRRHSEVMLLSALDAWKRTLLGLSERGFSEGRA